MTAKMEPGGSRNLLNPTSSSKWKVSVPLLWQPHHRNLSRVLGSPPSAWWALPLRVSMREKRQERVPGAGCSHPSPRAPLAHA